VDGQKLGRQNALSVASGIRCLLVELTIGRSLCSGEGSISLDYYLALRGSYSPAGQDGPGKLRVTTMSGGDTIATHLTKALWKTEPRQVWGPGR
jgi:hypothetical protein